METSQPDDVQDPAPTTRTVERLAAAALAACALSLVARWLLTGHLPFVVDELVDTQLASEVARGARLYLDRPHERLPLMTLVIAAFLDTEASSFAAVVSARKLMWLGTTAIFVATWLVARNVIGRRQAPWAVLLLMSFSSFLDRGLRVRADLVSTTLAVWALVLVTAPRLTLIRLAGAGLSLGLAVAATQKAVYFVVAFGVALCGRHLFQGGFGAQKLLHLAGRVAVAATSFAVPLLVIAIWAHRTDRLEQLIDQCFFYAANLGLVADTYASTWKYFGQSLVRNPAFWGFALAGITLLVRRPFAERHTGDERLPGRLALGLWSATLLGLFLQHTTKFPYIFINLSPCLAAAGALPLAGLVENHLLGSAWSLRRRRLAWAAMALLFVVAPVVFHLRPVTSGILRTQRAVMDRVDAITDAEDYVFDGAGMAVNRRKATPHSITARWADERNAGAPFTILPWLQERRPLVWIVNYRLKRLTRDERAFLESHYVLDWHHVRVVGAKVEHRGETPTVRTIDLLATTHYALRADDRSAVRIDGRPAASVEALAAGPHEIAVDGPPQEVLLIYARAFATPPPSAVVGARLFPGYSR